MANEPKSSNSPLRGMCDDTADTRAVVIVVDISRQKLSSFLRILIIFRYVLGPKLRFVA